MKNEKKFKKEIRELSKGELESVNGGLGFLAVLIPIAIAVITGGCATIPHKGEHHDNHNN